MKSLFFVATVLFSFNAFSQCQIFSSNGEPTPVQSDVLYQNLASRSLCPENVLELKEVLEEDGLQTSPSMVANRGFHNPRFGSFSFFEIAFGPSKTMGKTILKNELYFGHFTRAQSGHVILDQEPRPGKLLIELIAWDMQKEVYNFYELIGKTQGATWFYRGDSTDAFKDNQLLKRQKDANNPKFGRRMRCSACHTSGGPIMKELAAPHNAWWKQKRPLPFTPNIPSDELTPWLESLMDASEFADSVKSGMQKLEDSPKFKAFQKSLSLQEQLRPLFCTTEINLVSDTQPLESNVSTLHVPSPYWVNPTLVSSSPIEIQKKDYVTLLEQMGFQFPETQRMDADHGWLAPVKGHSDQRAIESLVEQGLVDPEFVADVLAVDFKKALFSEKRCSLLKRIPLVEEVNWQKQFTESLKESHSEAAQTLYKNLTSPVKNRAHHQKQALKYLQSIKEEMTSSGFLKKQILRLQEQRLSVFEDEISQNPRGQILEPGFRVIFPENQNIRK